MRIKYKTQLKHRVALWLLDQALPQAPDLTILMRGMFVTMAAGAAAGVALVATFALALMGFYELMLPEIGSGWALTACAGIGALLLFTAYNFINTRIALWGKRRTLLRAEADVFDQVKTLAGSLLGEFVDGFVEERFSSRTRRRVRAKAKEVKADVEEMLDDAEETVEDEVIEPVSAAIIALKRHYARDK